MNNYIEKLYELAKVKKDWESLPYGDIKEYYPPFTVEKQLKLIKYLSFQEVVIIQNWGACFTIGRQEILTPAIKETETEFEQALAGLVIKLWQDLTPEQQAEIRSILQ